MPPEVVFIVVVSIVAVTIWVWVGVKYGTQQHKPEALDAIEKRLARLEVAIDDLTSELSRVTEGQQFTNKLLADRSPEMIREPR
jgi:prefoldin subunit 5